MLFAKRLGEVIRQWFDQIGDRAAVGGFDEGLDWHAGDQHRAFGQAFDLTLVQDDLNPVIALPGVFIFKGVSGDGDNLADQLWRFALVQRGKAQGDILINVEFVDMDGFDLCVNHQWAVLWNQKKHWVGRAG